MDGGDKKMHSAVFTVCKLDRRYNQLYLAITEQQKRSHFAGIVDNLFAIAVSRGWCNSTQEHEPRIWVNVVVLDYEPLDHAESRQNPKLAESNKLSIFCTDAFLSRYGFIENKTYYVEMIRPSPLTKLTLATDNVQAFTWASSQIFSTGLLLNVCNQHNVIARTGDIFAIPYSELFEQDDEFSISFLTNLEVVETEPFYQGVVMVNTEILILNKTALQKIESELGVPETEPRKPAAAVHISDFAVPLTSVFIPRQVNRPTLYRNASNTVCLQRDWNVLPYQYLHTVKYAAVESATDHTVYAYMTTLKRFSLFNDSLIEIVIETNTVAPALTQPIPSAVTRTKVNQSKTRTKLVNVCRVVHLKAFQPKVEDAGVDHHKERASSMQDKLFLPCNLLFNLQRGYTKHMGQDLLIKIRKYQPESEYLTSVSTSWNGHLPYAREVYVSCVYSPQYSTGTAYSTVLQKYFLTPKTFQKDDVFAVDTSIDIEFTQNSEGGSSIFPVVYFKVKRITPRMKKKTQTYLVDTNHTALYQDGPCHSYVPSCMDRVIHRSHDHLTVPGLSHHIDKLTELIQPYLTKWCQPAESAPAILLHGNAGCGKMAICQAIASACNMHYFRVNCHDLCGEASSATEARILQTFMRACMYSPCVLHLCNIHALGKDRDGNNEDSRVSSYFHECVENVLHKESPDWPVIVLATTSNLNSLTRDMHAGFLHTFEIEVPNQSARKVMLQSLLNDVQHVPSLSLERITQRTAGFVLGDLEVLVAEAKKEAYRKIVKLCFPGNTTPSPQDEYCVSVCQPVLSQSDFDAALDKLQAAHSDAIGAPKIPNVTWADVGGLTSVKADILDTLQLPLQHPELFTAGLHRSGVLLFGPPGTGKTLLAKAVATECSLNFLSVKGPELINMYVGQSEENIREVFSRARNATPCVIFFDELDSLAPNRGRSGDSGGVMDRVVSQLLAELDGLQKSCDVFVIGATNRPDLLDPALLRPGRFDKLLYLGVSEDKETKLHILNALTRKFNLSPSCNLSNIVEKCPDNMTGADFYALCSDAMLNALKREIHKIETGVSTCEEKVEVSDVDFYGALKDLVPSISKTELERYKQLQYSLMAGK